MSKRIILWMRSLAFSPLILQIIRFGIIGVLAASIHLSLVILLVQTGLLQPLVANVFAFMLSFQVSYWGHFLWTFKQSTTFHRVAFPKLLIVQIFNLAANESLFYIFLSLHLPYPIALIIVLTLLPLFTFLSSRQWIFR